METALFPGYLFCRFIASNRMPVLTTPGVFSIVSVAKHPAPIPDDEIHAIRRVVESGLDAESLPYVTEGERVRIESGPLRDTVGIVIGTKSGRRITVSIHLLQRSVAAELGPDTEFTVLGEETGGPGNISLERAWMF